MKPFTIALPAGRLAEESVAFFRKSGIADFTLTDKGRELSFFDPDSNIRIVLVRSRDVPTYVEQGAADAGITGRDVLLEADHNLTMPMTMAFGYCHLSVAVRTVDGPAILQRPHLRVATKYSNLAMDYFFRKGISCEIIKLNGSIELAPILDMADCIVDLVSTGATLKANGLLEVEKILESSAVLVISRSAWVLHNQRINEMLHRFQKAVA
ncbi:MAG: ATP phosphoribosyltransferase [Leptospiraceae bacterium]|nr:ATP phosphoribosyltransferase [Leptospiraceae bacterium]